MSIGNKFRIMTLLLDHNTYRTLFSILDTPKEGGDTTEEYRGAVSMVRVLRGIGKTKMITVNWGISTLKSKKLKMYNHDIIIFKYLKRFQVEKINFLLSSPKDNIRRDKNNGEEDYCKLESLLQITDR